MISVFSFVALAQPIAIAAYPARPLIERSSCCQFLNFDFVLTNPADQPAEVVEIRLTLVDDRGFGAAVVAPGDGTVLDSENGSPDRVAGVPPFDEAAVGTDYRQYLGNFVVIDHHNGEYSVLAHLRQGTVTAKRGDRVRAGQRIAEIGLSGEGGAVPHLHYQLQDGPDPFRSEGLPSYFNGFYRLLGARRVLVPRGHIDTGDILTR